jgi:PAS domain S-box-containing protein
MAARDAELIQPAAPGLLQRAQMMSQEEAIAAATGDVADLSPQALRETLHNLRLHQIELEMQNEELRRTQAELDSAHARYFDFYDLAPVGYVTVNEKALILQANIKTAALLDLPRAKLIGKKLPSFMPVADADRYYLLCQQALASASAQSCELRLNNSRGNPVWVSLQAIAVPGDQGTAVIRMVLSDIAARKNLEERLICSEANTQAVLDGASDAIFITDTAGRYQYVNLQATKLLGFSRDELLGMSFSDITPENDLATARVLFQQLLQTGVLRFEPLLKRGDGSTVWTELNCRVLADGRVFGACRDITERKQAEALRLANTKFRDAILDSVPSQIAVLDPTGIIVAVNRTWREFARNNSATPGELVNNSQIGTNYLDNCCTAQVGDSQESATLARDGILSVIRGTAPFFRLEYPCHSPTQQRWFAMAVTPLNVENPGVVITHTDITEQRQLRDHLLAQAVETEMAASRQQLRELVAFNATAIEAERKHIAREVHDELGQVLTALRMDMSLLHMQFGALDPALPTKVNNLKVLVDRAIQGVRNVATSLRPMALDMGLAAAIETLSAEFTARTEITCTFSSQHDLMDMDEPRAVEVYRIVQESLTNVSRYAQASQVQITLGFSGNALCVEMCDNGVGFLAAEVQQVKTFGLLGMRERATALGGRLDINSVPAQGTVVRLTVPVQKETIGGVP